MQDGYDEDELNLIVRKFNERIERNLQIIEEYDKKIKSLRNNQKDDEYEYEYDKEDDNRKFKMNYSEWTNEETVNYLLNQQNQQMNVISSTNITSINLFDIFSDINCK